MYSLLKHFRNFCELLNRVWMVRRGRLNTLRHDLHSGHAAIEFGQGCRGVHVTTHWIYKVSNKKTCSQKCPEPQRARFVFNGVTVGNIRQLYRQYIHNDR